MSSSDYLRVVGKMQNIKESLKKKSRTPKLWIMYMDYIETIQEFIAAERTSNWQLHLVSASKMLNLFAATGHGNYAKSMRLYLQDMNAFPEKHPEMYKFFEEGRHTVKRTKNKFGFTRQCF